MPRPRPLTVAALALAAALLLPHARLAGQGTHGVMLEIRPRIGDTIPTRLDQRTLITAFGQGADGDSTTTVETVLALFSRAIVKGRAGDGTRVLTRTDSVSMESTDGDSRAVMEQARGMLVGKTVSMVVHPDGTMHVIESSDGVSPEIENAVALMPAALPRGPVRVGDTWRRTMVVPMMGRSDGRGAGTLRATFHFDSLSDDGTLAWISMRGSLTRDQAAEETPEGARFEVTGNVIGNMLVNRRRGWLTDSRFSVFVRSLVTPPPGSQAQPMRFETRVTLRLRTMDKR